MCCDIFRLSYSKKQRNKDSVQLTTAQLYPGRDTFEFDQGHVTKNKPITVLILLSESLAISGVATLHTAAALAMRAAVKTELSNRNDTMAFFFAANKNKDDGKAALAKNSGFNLATDI